MNRIVYVGIDVHSTNFAFCSIEPVFGSEDKVFGIAQIAPGYQSVLKYIGQIKKNLPEDEQVKEYVRMRDDHWKALKKVKQQINAFCLRHGHHYPGKSKWIIAHVKWLKGLELDTLDREILNEYYQTYEYHVDRIEQFDRRIEDLSSEEAYAEKVKKLRCFLGIKTVTAVALIVESGDFSRFQKGNIYAAYLGLIPGEKSSGDNYQKGGVTKAGNRHLRALLTEASQSICKGTIGHKSKALKAR